MSKTITTADFIDSLSIISPTIQVLGQYTAAKDPIHCRCLVCNHEWDPIVSVLTYNKAGCPKCAGNMKPTHDEFVKKLYAKNPQITVLGHYVDSKTHIDVECNICHHVWPVKPNNLIRGTGCPKCASRSSAEKQRKSHQQFLSEMQEKGNPSVEILGTYVNANTNILCRCRQCNYEWSPSPSSLLQGHGCKKCADSAKRGRKRKKVADNV